MSSKYVYRCEIYPNADRLSFNDVDVETQKTWFKKYLSVDVRNIWGLKYFLVETNAPVDNFRNHVVEVFTDSVVEVLLTSVDNNQNIVNSWLQQKNFEKPDLVDISFRPGVTDNTAHATLEALKLIPALKNVEMKVASGSMYFIETIIPMNKSELEKLAYEKLANNLLHKVQVSDFVEIAAFNRMKNLQFPAVNIKAESAKTIDLNVSDSTLAKMNQDNCWALSSNELNHIKDYYKSLNRMPTDVEMEVIAQSWSEHCKHKIFASEITYSESHLPAGVKPLGDLNIKGIFKTYIRGATKKIEEERKIPWLISIFHDNAGIVRFDDIVDVCIKVETHNSPSALDPYGGALTGILGVNRDILGVGQGARPIANTNVFCLAENSYFTQNNIALPLLLKNPDRIKEGVHLGVQDGGNKSGIPTVNGAFVFDRDFVGKPLVFCGTVGVMPQVENKLNTCEKRQRPGDLIVMAGGRIGKDGIHGATFSSMELADGVPSSVVQIGDPITQKRLGDFLIEARTLGLFNSVTDNGAGGLSSSVGEMAQLTNGARVDLEKALVKYPGLSPFELMVSESQERMTFSVPVETLEKFLELAKSRSVEASVIGEFNSSGQLSIYYENKLVADLNMHFLHESLLPMKLSGHFNPENTQSHWIKESVKKGKRPQNYSQILLDLFRTPNIRSHEHLIRRYDHEVKAATIVKPFTGTPEVGFSAPSDAGVVWLKPHGGGADNALAIASGICPKVSKFDTYTMAEYAVDEAVRNAVCVGANPDEMVLVDNYCWPDSIPSERNPDAEMKLAQLVRASKALYDISIDYGMPFVSGKDSMKNDFIGMTAKNEKVKISVPPTLLVTAMGRVPTLSMIRTSEIKSAGDFVYLIGETLTQFKSAFELAELYDDYDVNYPLPSLNFKKQLEIYRQVHSALKKNTIESSHDISDGGLILSLAEKMMGTKLGVKISLDMPESDLSAFLFNEGGGRLLVTVKPENQKAFEACFQGLPILLLGETNDSGFLIAKSNKVEILKVSGTECMKNYKCLVGEI
ncbi:MAG: AIR synthase-related protein [Bacteriovorax sp.]|jgi:phosphoribosylformylglycinamidine synthase